MIMSLIFAPLPLINLLASPFDFKNLSIFKASIKLISLLVISTLGKLSSVSELLNNFADDEAILEDEITLIVQVNGKVRERLIVPATIDSESAKAQALSSENVKRYIDGKDVQKVIYVPGRLVNIVVK